MRNEPKKMRSKYKGVCTICKCPIEKGQPIVYWTLNRTADHEICAAPSLQRIEEDKWDAEQWETLYPNVFAGHSY